MAIFRRGVFFLKDLPLDGSPYSIHQAILVLRVNLLLLQRHAFSFAAKEVTTVMKTMEPFCLLSAKKHFKKSIQ